jgi:hypothetical protein
MKVEKGKYYMAGLYGAWKCYTIGRPNKGNILVRWETGFLKGREARIQVKDMKACGPND